jgi:hypothetical protein
MTTMTYTFCAAELCYYNCPITKRKNRMNFSTRTLKFPIGCNNNKHQPYFAENSYIVYRTTIFSAVNGLCPYSR